MSDAHTSEAARLDSAIATDGALPDSATRDASMPDSATRDASMPDSATRDASAPDAGVDAAAAPLLVDEVVSDAASLRARLMAWASDWAGTVPPGKDPSDERVIGLDTTVIGNIDLSGLRFPERVCVRSVGTFSDDYTSSTYVQGTIDMSGSSNLWLCLMDIRAPGTGRFATGLVNLDSTTDCGVERCSFSGWPFVVAPGATGTTSYAISPNGATRLTVKHNVYRYFADGFAKWRGRMDNLHLEGNMGLYSGGDDYTSAAGSVLNDPVIIANYFDRHHAKAPGVHNDGWQQNGNGAGSQMNRYVLRYNVGYRGTWTGTGETRENGWQLWYMAGAGAASVGPWLAEHCLFINGQQRGIDRIPGAGTLTVRYSAAIDSDVAPSQVANARFPRIIGAEVRERNFVTAPRVGYTNGAGTNGIEVILGNPPDHTPLAMYMETIPTDTTDLWDEVQEVTARVVEVLTDWLRGELEDPPDDLEARVFVAFAAVRGVVQLRLIAPASAPADDLIVDQLSALAVRILTDPPG